jgi:hypothetical protein
VLKIRRPVISAAVTLTGVLAATGCGSSGAKTSTTTGGSAATTAGPSGSPGPAEASSSAASGGKGADLTVSGEKQSAANYANTVRYSRAIGNMAAPTSRLR